MTVTSPARSRLALAPVGPVPAPPCCHRARPREAGYERSPSSRPPSRPQDAAAQRCAEWARRARCIGPARTVVNPTTVERTPRRVRTCSGAAGRPASRANLTTDRARGRRRSGQTPPRAAREPVYERRPAGLRRQGAARHRARPPRVAGCRRRWHPRRQGAGTCRPGHLAPQATAGRSGGACRRADRRPFWLRRRKCRGGPCGDVGGSCAAGASRPSAARPQPFSASPFGPLDPPGPECWGVLCKCRVDPCSLSARERSRRPGSRPPLPSGWPQPATAGHGPRLRSIKPL